MMNIIFDPPNADFEWCEAKRYPHIFTTKETWLNAIQHGKEIDPETLCLAGIIKNTDYDQSLDAMQYAFKKYITRDRQRRITKMFNQTDIRIELPIVMKYADEYELIAGNTRLTKMGILHRQSGFPVRVFLINPI